MFDTAATLERTITWVRRAAGQGARLIVLPEALLGGYPKGLDFGVRVGSRDPAGRKEFQRYWDAAIDVPGPQSRALSALMPLFRAAMYAKGVDIWCAPTVDDRDSWLATMRHIALEGRCFVLSACQYLERDGLPPDVHPVQGDDPGTVLISGGSVIVSPLGEVLAGRCARAKAC